MKVNQFVWVILFSIFITNFAYSQQEECENAIEEAKKYWSSNYYDDAIDLLTECLPGLTDKAPAYELLALAYLSKEFQRPAKNMLVILFQLVPDYEIQFGTQDAEFMKFVEGVRKKPKKGGGKKFLWISIGAAAIAGGLVVALTGGGDGPGPGTTNGVPDLPPPPDDPVRN